MLTSGAQHAEMSDEAWSCGCGRGEWPRVDRFLHGVRFDADVRPDGDLALDRTDFRGVERGGVGRSGVRELSQRRVRFADGGADSRRSRCGSTPFGQLDPTPPCTGAPLIGVYVSWIIVKLKATSSNGESVAAPSSCCFTEVMNTSDNTILSSTVVVPAGRCSGLPS